MMKNISKKVAGLLLTVMMACSVTTAFADQQTTIPVTLTVVHSVHAIDVTMPVCMPVSVVDGEVLTANNVKITNNSKYDGVEVAAVRVEDASYKVGDYEDFPTNAGKMIALNINGCSTKGPGALGINKVAFPIIQTGRDLPLTYMAKVGDTTDVSGLEAAHVVFTLRAVTPEV